MVRFKNERISESLQKCFPLKIVGLDEIPSPLNLLPCSDLEVDEVSLLSNLLIDLCKKKNGIGLSAFQCGIPLKFFIASEDGVSFRSFLDGSYSGIGQTTNSLEGCLSLVNEKELPRRFVVPRYEKIFFNAKELIYKDGIPLLHDLEQEIKGFFAVVIQHEVDHHEGKLISDFGKEVEVVS